MKGNAQPVAIYIKANLEKTEEEERFQEEETPMRAGI